jgi:LacI family transcriptional regulator
VLAAAAKLGYRRNPLVAALMADLRGKKSRGQQAHVIAYVESYPPEGPRQQTESLRRFRDGVTAGAAKHGFDVQVFHLGETGLSEARLEQVLEARGIRGVVFSPFPKTGSTLTQPWHNHALAALGYSLAQPPLHRAVNHQAHSIRLALAKLRALGYRRIGLVIRRHEDERTERNWLSSVLLAQHDGTETKTSYPLLLTEAIERRAVVAWVRRWRPEVVVTTEQEVWSILRRLRVAGAGRPGFAHLHLTPDLAGCSGIDQNNERVGEAAVDLVVEQLHGNAFGIPEIPKTVLIEGRWVAGTTTPGPGRNCGAKRKKSGGMR